MTPIRLFDPRREHSFVPITKYCHRRDAGTVKAGRIVAATRGGLALIGPSTAACLPAWAKGAARCPISNRWFSSIFTPLLTIKSQSIVPLERQPVTLPIPSHQGAQPTGSALAGVPPDYLDHRVLTQIDVANNEPIGQPVGMHTKAPAWPSRPRDAGSPDYRAF